MPQNLPGFDMGSLATVSNPYVAAAGAAADVLGGVLGPDPGNAYSSNTGGNVSINVGGMFSPGSGVSNVPGAGDVLGLSGGDDLGARIIQGILVTVIGGLVWKALSK